MPWIRTVPPDEAEGELARHYRAATERAGRVWNVVSLMSPNPRALDASMGMYRALLHGESPLSRGQREMIAVVVSATNHCVY
ncbi:MAG TPA: carboxymuconolactone decarboxylase family protein [Thermoanaerobaculia bacterium]|nr:carboxymuconolactone decarboxylase family protein [Thermoanaerobaculia bacterium]